MIVDFLERSADRAPDFSRDAPHVLRPAPMFSLRGRPSLRYSRHCFVMASLGLPPE